MRIGVAGIAASKPEMKRAVPALLLLSSSLVAGCSGSSSRARYAPYRAQYAHPLTQAPGVVWGSLAPQPFWAPQPAYDRPVDVSALTRLIAAHVPCAPVEVADGTWVRFDCSFQNASFVSPLTNPRHGFDAANLPAAMDLRTAGIDGPIKSQGSVGACTAFSLSTAMDVSARKQGRSDVISPLHLWSQYGVPSMGVAGDETENDPIALESTWPYDPKKACELSRDPSDSCGDAYDVRPASGIEDPVLQAEKKAADAQGHYKVAGLEQLSRPFDSAEAAGVIAGGDPIWMSISVNDEAWKSRNLENDAIQDYGSAGDEGHAFVLVGYRNAGDGRQFLVHNSWGTKWGDGGYAWINDSTLRRWGRSAYKVRVADVQGGAPLPSMNGCNDGQVRDAVLGTCTNPCSSGSAPSAGICLSPVPGLSIPGLPSPQPSPRGGCAAGEVTDPMTNRCVAACPGGMPPIGGMCLPAFGR
jgi:hypothetical protein